MARIRTIKPEFFRSEDIGQLTPLARLLFIGLWTMADREGRLMDRPRRISVELFPYDDDFDVSPLLDELAGADLIRRYAAGGDGQKCIQIQNFGKHQRPHPKEPPSEIPPEQEQRGRASREKKRPAVKRNGEQVSGRVDLGMDYGSGKGREGEDCAETAEPSSPPADPPVPGLDFPVDGGDPEVPGSGTWHATEAVIRSLQAGFPSLDVMGECRKAKAWAEANPVKRKTAGGMRRFLVTWMSKEQNNGGGRRYVNGAQAPPKSWLEQQSDRAIAEAMAMTSNRRGT